MNKHGKLFFILLWYISYAGCSRSQEKQPLEKAVTDHYYKLAEKLLSNGEDPNERGPIESTPIEIAVEKDDTAMIKILLDHGADIHSRYPPTNNSLLSECVSTNRFKAAKFLIERGLSPDTPDTILGGSPLIQAIFMGNIPMVSLLLKYGANPNFVNTDKDTPLGVAIHERRSLQPTILKKMDEMQTGDSTGEMRRYLSLQIIQLLLKSGATANSPFPLEKGDTYLHQASESCDTSVVQLLLQYGANRDVKNEEGMTPLDVAKKNGCKEVEELLAK